MAHIVACVIGEGFPLEGNKLGPMLGLSEGKNRPLQDVAELARGGKELV